MGTRGFITFVADGQEKTAYNHWDSYPEGLGSKVLSFLVSQQGLDNVAVQARALRVVSPDSKPTAEDIERFSKFSWTKAEHGGDADLRKGQEWYDLLHETQGNVALILEAGVIEDASGFPCDSLFAEWGYVIDFDAGAFEVYRGFQKARHKDGRFAGREVTDHSASVGTYYPVRRVASWRLSDLPSKDAFLAELEEPDEDESL